MTRLAVFRHFRLVFNLKQPSFFKHLQWFGNKSWVMWKLHKKILKWIEKKILPRTGVEPVT
jgi:hypothetical protein